jgi:hypothetical protein
MEGAAMRPWQHAQLSAGELGDWRADLEIHEFIDSSKLAFPSVRHRMILHNNDLGPELAARAFPHRPDARAIALNHVTQDFKVVPSLAEWLDLCEVHRFPRPREDHAPVEKLPSMIAEELELETAEDPRIVLDLLLVPVALAGSEAQCILFNAMGPFLVRRILGQPRLVPGNKGKPVMFEPALAAEKMIRHIYGVIPALGDVVNAVRQLPAMLKEAG